MYTGETKHLIAAGHRTHETILLGHIIIKAQMACPCSLHLIIISNFYLISIYERKKKVVNQGGSQSETFPSFFHVKQVVLIAFGDISFVK